MPISFGNTTITKAYFGNTQVSRIYLGGTLVFSAVGRILLENSDILITEGGDTITLE